MNTSSIKSDDNRNIRVLQFLEAYQRQECLWNPSLESYKNKVARDDAYMKIISELGMNLTIHDVKLKVKSIRTTYKKELRILNKHKQEGKQYTPKLFWFNRADAFLKNVSLSRQKNSMPEKIVIDPYKPFAINYIDTNNRSSIEQTIEDQLEEDIGNHSCNGFDYKTSQTDIDCQSQEHMQILETSTDENDTILIPISNKIDNKNRTKCDDATKNKANVMNESHQTHNTLSCNDTNLENEYDLFCRSVAVQLRSIKDNYSRSVAKLKIQQILFEAETGHYRNNPCITIPVSQNLSNL